MKAAFFLVLRQDVQHFLHGASLVRDLQRRMPGVPVVQLTDVKTPAVPGTASVLRHPAPDITPQTAALLDLRLTLYAACARGARGDNVLYLDTDVSVRNDVRGVFDDPHFDVAVCDRNWPHLPQGEALLQTMPFNTGVVFCRHPSFWDDVLTVWRGYPSAQRADWMSEQTAVYDVVRTGRYRVKILPGMAYNYPPSGPDDAPVLAALIHYKGPRKAWLSTHAYQVLAQPW